MTKEEFEAILRRQIEELNNSLKIKEKYEKWGDPIVKYFGPGPTEQFVSIGQAVDSSYISEQEFFRIIDIAVIAFVGNRPVIFYRVSGHKPGPLSETWNGRRGPFKTIQSQEVTFYDDLEAFKRAQHLPWSYLG